MESLQVKGSSRLGLDQTIEGGVGALAEEDLAVLGLIAQACGEVDDVAAGLTARRAGPSQGRGTIEMDTP